MWYDDEQNVSELPSQQYFYPYVNEKFFTEELIDHSGQPESSRRK